MNPSSNSFNPADFLFEAGKDFTVASDLRLGQFLVNRLTQLHPEIKVPPEADCYYDDGKISAFMDFLYQYPFYRFTATKLPS